MGYLIVLILEELFANVHKYSLGDPPAAAIEVGLERDGDTLVVDFVDDGGAFNPLAMPPPISSAVWKNGRSAGSASTSSAS